jgi:hypothetical protein
VAGADAGAAGAGAAACAAAAAAAVVNGHRSARHHGCHHRRGTIPRSRPHQDRQTVHGVRAYLILGYQPGGEETFRGSVSAASAGCVSRTPCASGLPLGA